MTNKKNTFCIVMIILAILLLAFDAVYCVFLYRQNKNTTKISATLAEIRTVENNGGKTTDYYLSYTIHGTSYYSKVKGLVFGKKVGNIVKIRVKNDDPYDIKTVSSGALIITILTLVGIGFATIGILSYGNGINAKRKIKALKERGHKVTATVKALKKDFKKAVDHRYIYSFAVCVYKDMDGNLLTFATESFLTDSAKIKLGDSLTVYYDDKNPRNYYIDMQSLVVGGGLNFDNPKVNNNGIDNGIERMNWETNKKEKDEELSLPTNPKDTFD